MKETRLILTLVFSTMLAMSLSAQERRFFKEGAHAKKPKVVRLAVNIQQAPDFTGNADDNSSTVPNLFDGKRSTVWTHPVSEMPVMMKFNVQTSAIQRIIIHNGNCKSTAFYDKFARAKHIYIVDATLNPNEKGEYPQYIYKGTLRDTKQPQTLRIDPKKLKGVNSLMLVINDCYGANKRDHLSLSEVQRWGNSNASASRKNKSVQNTQIENIKRIAESLERM